MKKNISTVLSLALMTALSLGVSGCGSDDDPIGVVSDAYDVYTDGGTISSNDIGDLSNYSIVYFERNINQEEIDSIKALSAQTTDFKYELVSDNVTCPSLGYSSLLEEYETDITYEKVYSTNYVSYCVDTIYKSTYYNSGSESVLVYYNY